MTSSPETAEPEISVVIPHYRDLVNLDICLSGLMRQTFPRDRFEVVVADNNSPEGEAAVAKAIDGRARLTIVPEKGAGPARNGGVAAARGRILAFIDSDCRPEPQWLEEGIAALDRCDFAGGRVKVLVNDAEHMTAAEAFETVFAFDMARYVKHKQFTGSGNLFCSRAVFEAVGGFRTGMSEDVEWCHRAAAAGYRLGYSSSAAVGHPARREWSELRAKWQRVNAETYGLFAARRWGKIRWLLRSWLLPISAFVHAPRVLTTTKIGSTRDRMLALSMLFRLRCWRFIHAHRLLFSATERR